MIILIPAGCKNSNSKRVPVAKAGKSTLYLDQVNSLVPSGTPSTDSIALVKKGELITEAEESILKVNTNSREIMILGPELLNIYKLVNEE